ncbi:MAG: hypothetical protein AB1649_27420, partial [Chloroflexota bacterium]
TLKAAYPEVDFIAQKDFRRDVLRIANPYSHAGFVEKIFNILNTLISLLIFSERLNLRVWQSILMRLRVYVLGELLPALPDESYILFLVDDNIFVRDFSLKDVVPLLRAQQDALGFSLRLGSNITHCYTSDQPQPLPRFVPVETGILKFDWTTSELDFGYPLEVSSSAYRAKDMFPIIAKQPFRNPNELEFQLAVSAKAFSRKMPFLLCPERSYTFCNPLNVVQNVTPNKAGASLEYSSQRLADLFDQGYRIKVEAYHGFIPQSCHQEVPLEFYRLWLAPVK